MKKKLLNIISTSLISVFIFIGSLAPTVAYAANDPICSGIGAAAGHTDGCGSTNQSTSIEGTIVYVVNILSIVGGIIAVFAIAYAGLRFTLSGGDSNNVSSAKDTILYAIVGIVVIAVAQIIVHFVLTNVPGH